MTKIDLITGFLGSGKTTFIKRYVHHLLSNGEKVGIIENDFGAISVDLLLLHEEFGDDIGLEMIVAADKDCYRRRFKAKLISMGMLGYDRIIVEPSGIYDVDEFFDILFESPLDRWYQRGNVISVVDSNLGDLSETSKYILAAQLSASGIVVLSKLDAADSDLATATRERMNQVLADYHCRRKLEDKDILAKPWSELDDNDYAKIQSAGYYSESYQKEDIYDNNHYTSLFYYNVHLTEEDMRKMLLDLFADTAVGNIHRIKGFVPNADGSWLQVNATSTNLDIATVRAGQEVLMVIGENLDETEIGKIVEGRSTTKNITKGKTAHREHKLSYDRRE